MKNVHVSHVIKFAGAYIACMIGSGFATGQEILQFYTAFGIKSILTAIVCMTLLSWFAASVMCAGRDTKEPVSYAFRWFFGEKFGRAFEVFVTFFLFCLITLMVSGAGATLNEHYGLPYYIGSGVMALMAFCSYAFGMKNLINILGFLTPIIIGCTMFVGIVTLIRSGCDLRGVDEALASVPLQASAPGWFVSGVLYAAYNVIGGVIFMARLGRTADSKKEAALSGALGGVVFISALTIMNLAFLANIKTIGHLQIPTMYLAGQISPYIATAFSIVIFLGMFSVAAPMTWTVCDRFADEGSWKSRIICAAVLLASFAGGQLPFGKLVSIIYPITGYLGILLYVSVAVYRIRRRRHVRG